MGVSYTFVPGNDAELLNWSITFKTILSASTAAYFMTAGQATSFATAQVAFAAALATATTPATRTKSAIAAKDVAKKNLQMYARSFGRMIQANVQISDQMKIDIGVTVRKQPQPIPAPTASPIIEIGVVNGWTINMKLKSTDSARRGKPAGVSGATVFSYVGPQPPTDISQYKFEGNITQTKFQVAFSPTLAAGTKVWLTAFWFSGRAQSGPACAPISTNLQGGTVMMAA